MESSIKHSLFVFVLLLWRFQDSASQAETKISTICNTTNSTRAMLSCSSNSWYHVIQEMYSPVNYNCSLDNSKNNLQENSERGLSVSCAGPASPPNSSVCEESVKMSTRDYNEAFVEVAYECINVSKTYNLCLKQEMILEEQVYLASPLMFASSEQSSFNSCLCEITDVLKVEVLYADVDSSNLDITCGNWTRNEFLFQNTVVNIDLAFLSKPCTMTIIYRDDNRSGSSLKGRVWIKVSGSNMTLKCSEKPPDPVTTLSATSTDTMSATTSSSTKTPSTTTLISQESSPDSTTISSKYSPSSISPPTSCISLPKSSNSGTSQPVTSISPPILSTSQFLSSISQTVSSTSQPVSTTSQPVSSTSQPVSSTLQSVSTTSQPVSSTSQPVSSTTQSTSSTLQHTSGISQSAWIAPIYLIVPVVVGGVALIATVVAVLAVRKKCCQTRAETRDNCSGLGKKAPALKDEDNRFSTHSCDVYVDLDDVSTTPLPDSPALCLKTIQNGVREPSGSDVIMFDNVAYVSGPDVISKRDVMQGDDNDSDEVLMVDNDLYESSAPVGTIKTFQMERTSNTDDSTDKVIMIDNLVYVPLTSTSPA